MPTYSPQPAASTISPLRQLRISSGTTASDFARLVGVDLSTLYAVETGSRRVSAQFRVALGRLGIDPDAVIEAHRSWCDQQSTRLSESLGEKFRRAEKELRP